MAEVEEKKFECVCHALQIEACDSCRKEIHFSLQGRCTTEDPIRLTIEWKLLNNLSAWMKKKKKKRRSERPQIREKTANIVQEAFERSPQNRCGMLLLNWTSASNNAQNWKSETARTCLQDSGRSNVVGKRLYHSCQQMGYKIIEPHEYLEQLSVSG